MNRYLNIILAFIILFFTGCSGFVEYLKDVDRKFSKKTPSTATERKEMPRSSYYLERGLEFEKNDELQMALFYLKVAGSLNPENEDLTGKIADLKSTIDQKTDQYYKNGVEAYNKKRYNAARKLFLIALRYTPDHKNALDYLKNRLIAGEPINYTVKEKDTLESISKTFYKDPEKVSLIVYFNDLKSNAEPVTGTILKLPILPPEFMKPSLDVENKLINAKRLLNKRRYDDVLKISEKILKMDAGNKGAVELKNAAYFQMGEQLSRRDKNFDAVKMFRKVTSEHEGVEEAIQVAIHKEVVKAEHFLKEKKYEKAMEIAEKILSHEKSKPAEKLLNTAICQKGKRLLSRKKYAEALQLLTKGDPTYLCVGKTISAANKTMNEEAEKHYLRGVKHFLNEDLQDAIKEWEKTLQLNPEHKKAKKNIKNARDLLDKLQKVQ